MSAAHKHSDWCRHSTGAWAIELLPGIGKAEQSAWVRIKIPDDEAREKHALPHVHGPALADALERYFSDAEDECESGCKPGCVHEATVAALRAAGRLP